MSSGNLDIPILLASPNNQTVPLLAYNQFNDGSLSQAAATFCLLIGIVAAVLVLAAAMRFVLRLRAAGRSPVLPALRLPAGLPGRSR